MTSRVMNNKASQYICILVGTLEHKNRKIESCEFVTYPKERYVGLHMQFWP